MKYNIKRAFLFAGFCLGMITSASAQVVSLDSVLAIIDRQNPMLEEYDNSMKAFDAYAGGARSWMAPMVGAGTFMTPYPNQMLMEEADSGALLQ